MNRGLRSEIRKEYQYPISNKEYPIIKARKKGYQTASWVVRIKTQAEACAYLTLTHSPNLYLNPNPSTVIEYRIPINDFRFFHFYFRLLTCDLYNRSVPVFFCHPPARPGDPVCSIFVLRFAFRVSRLKYSSPLPLFYSFTCGRAKGCA